ncbi:YdbC family protein [Paenibacillus crassostreae]|uniref:YdbC family protein n=1 Tax=Paenibacillus crassostreae TaxID=1763538 RepID=UPI0009EDFEBC|nr:PC4/YdbC family ssDNA-binding protein [Paenibacillus crassostreae]
MNFSGKSKLHRARNNLISWNDREPKYDIREWSPEHDKMDKGVTLSKDEIVALRDLLNGLGL